MVVPAELVPAEPPAPSTAGATEPQPQSPTLAPPSAPGQQHLPIPLPGLRRPPRQPPRFQASASGASPSATQPHSHAAAAAASAVAAAAAITAPTTPVEAAHSTSRPRKRGAAPIAKAPKPAKVAKRRVPLTDAQRRTVCEIARDDPSLSHDRVARAFFEASGIGVERSTVTKVLGRASELLDRPLRTPNAKRRQASRYPEIEAATYEFLRSRSFCKLGRDFLSDSAVVGFARVVAGILGINEFKASKTWLPALKRRHRLGKVKEVGDDDGESGKDKPKEIVTLGKLGKAVENPADVYDVWVTSEVSEQVATLQEFSRLEDVYNLHATTLYYDATPCDVDWDAEASCADLQSPVRAAKGTESPASGSAEARRGGAGPSSSVAPSAPAILASGAEGRRGSAGPCLSVAVSIPATTAGGAETGQGSAGPRLSAAASIGNAGSSLSVTPSTPAAAIGGAQTRQGNTRPSLSVAPSLTATAADGIAAGRGSAGPSLSEAPSIFATTAAGAEARQGSVGLSFGVAPSLTAPAARAASQNLTDASRQMAASGSSLVGQSAIARRSLNPGVGSIAEEEGERDMMLCSSEERQEALYLSSSGFLVDDVRSESAPSGQFGSGGANVGRTSDFAGVGKSGQPLALLQEAITIDNSTNGSADIEVGEISASRKGAGSPLAAVISATRNGSQRLALEPNRERRTSPSTRKSVTALLCASGAGTHHVTPWVIGSKRISGPRDDPLRPFPGLAVCYKATGNGWLTAAILVEWLKWFDRSQSHSVLLVTSLLTTNDIACLSLKWVTVLPVAMWVPRSPSSLFTERAETPMDMVLMKLFRARYRAASLERVLAYMRNGVCLPEMSLRQACEMVSTSWQGVKAGMIKTSFRSSSIVSERFRVRNRSSCSSRKMLEKVAEEIALESKISEFYHLLDGYMFAKQVGLVGKRGSSKLDIERLITLENEACILNPYASYAELLASVVEPKDDGEETCTGLRQVEYPKLDDLRARGDVMGIEDCEIRTRKDALLCMEKLIAFCRLPENNMLNTEETNYNASSLVMALKKAQSQPSDQTDSALGEEAEWNV